MGYLSYGNRPHITIDDRLLRHLMVVCSGKLRHHESFMLEVVRRTEEGAGREVLWISRSMPILFHYESTTHETLDKILIADLQKQADRGHMLINLQHGGVE
jgi:hypothetical protein